MAIESFVAWVKALEGLADTSGAFAVFAIIGGALFVMLCFMATWAAIKLMFSVAYVVEGLARRLAPGGKLGDDASLSVAHVRDGFFRKLDRRTVLEQQVARLRYRMTTAQNELDALPGPAATTEVAELHK